MRAQAITTAILFFIFLNIANADIDLTICEEAAKDCDFEFLGFEGTVPLLNVEGPPDTPLSTRIVSKDPTETLGVLNSNGITPEAIGPEGEAVPITEFGTPPYTPSHTKPFPLPDGGSGICFQTFTGNQLSLARGQCARVFFSSYQLIVGPKPTDVKNVSAKKGDFKCVAFRT